MKLTAEIICFLILLAPIVWEYRDDSGPSGDTNKKKDVLIRSIIAAVMCLSNYGISTLFYLNHSLLQSGLMCFALFFLIFDYWISWHFAPHGQWFSYIPKKGWFDNMPGWKKNPWVRFGIKLAVLIGALLYYF